MTPTADFSCAICLETASEPVVTRCGHLFCWECLDHWLRRPGGVPECPVCKGRVDNDVPGDIIPLYGKGANRAANSGPSSSSSPPPTSNMPRPEARTTTSATAAPPAAAASSASSREPRSSAATEAGGTRPRPTAARAPTPPRAAVGGAFGRNAMPFQVGSFFFIFGGTMGMGFMSLVIFLWGLYQLLPMQEWLVRGRRELRHRLPRWGFGTPDNANPARGTAAAPAPASQDAQRGATPGQRDAANGRGEGRAGVEIDVPEAEVLIRNVCIGIFLISFLYTLLLF